VAYRRVRILIHSLEVFPSPDVFYRPHRKNSIKASPNLEVFHRLRRVSRSTFEKPSGNAKIPVTLFIHFTRNVRKVSDRSLTIGGEQVMPKASAKILGVVLDQQLQYKEHAARAAKRGVLVATLSNARCMYSSK